MWNGKEGKEIPAADHPVENCLRKLRGKKTKKYPKNSLMDHVWAKLSAATSGAIFLCEISAGEGCSDFFPLSAKEINVTDFLLLLVLTPKELQPSR